MSGAGASAWELPKSLEIGGLGYSIETDFRTVLYVISRMTDPEYEPDERAAICLQVMIPEWESIPPERYQEALDKLGEFIDAGFAPGSAKRNAPRTMDWDQDAPMIIPAVNRSLGREVRGLDYLHWWTFFGAYMEMGECLYTTVLGIRQKRAQGKPLEKYEREFYRKNKDLVDIKRRETEEERAHREELRKLFV